MSPTREIRLIARAVRDGWPLTSEDRATAVALLRATLDDPNRSLRAKLASVRLMALLDAVNVRRERAAFEERQGDVLTATAALRAALSSPQARHVLESLSDTLTAPTDPTPSRIAPEAPPSPPDSQTDTSPT